MKLYCLLTNGMRVSFYIFYKFIASNFLFNEKDSFMNFDECGST